MKINVGSSVKTSEGEEIGHVERVILDPDTKDVDAIVVHRGLILTRDVIVPLSLVQYADQSGVHLRMTKDQLHELPDFVERHYVARPGESSVAYPYTPGSILFPLAPTYGAPGLPANYQPLGQQEVREPSEDVEIAEGTEVRAVDGTIGRVGEVRTDPEADRVTEFTVRRGFGLTRDAVIPIEYVDQVADDHIKLSLTIDQVEHLPIPITDRYITREKPKGAKPRRRKKG
ncbi:MAG TPA: PRC-barrel domain-containing protein [Chloroflexota bacterium]|nr:PRC-barrel domain-containing protein [Chloroflexota bacterium]HEX2987896.1 PRC-barrel domain-containing protein [Chloroflexota bacterium]